MGFLERLFGTAGTAIEFHFLRWWRRYALTFVILLVLSVGYAALFSAPAAFPTGAIVTIPRGASAPEAAAELDARHVIRHSELLLLFLRAIGEDGSIQPGAYQFNSRESLFVVAYRLIEALYGIAPVKVTFIEGLTVREMASKIEAADTGIAAADFISAGGPYEGYLFPDTYLFQPSSNAADMVSLMRATFDRKIAEIEPQIAASGRSLSDIVIMASLVEREARTPEEKRIVAGILWNRIDKGIPLQVDAVFGYIFSRTTYSPSYKDLGVDSPYNTYTHTGLPPGPIDNPGLDSLLAAADPTKSKYLFYLTGKDSLMHYATTYAGHLANEQKYLR